MITLSNAQAPPNPYVGPRAFRVGETLYGRDREVVELLDLLIAERIVLLYSPSGAGKTSLIQATLIPALEAEGFRVLPVMRVNQEVPASLAPAPDANRYLLSAMLSLEETLPEEKQTPLEELASLELGIYLNRQRARSNDSNSAVLIFDQFEEILTIDPADRRRKAEFFAQVGTALRDRQRWALFALREDYIASLDPFLRLVPTRFSTTFRLELLGEAAAREAVQRPANQAGVDFGDPAAVKLVNDLRRVRAQRPEGTVEEQLGPYVEPVQLQVVCHRLWEKLPAEATQIKETDIEAVGDVDSALAGYYADRMTAIAAETGVSERAIRDWADRQLITEQGIRGQVLQGPERSEGLDNRAIWSLVDTHLVRAEKRRGATWFELAHDRLIEPVRADNAAWRKAHLSPLQSQAALWESQGRQSGLLLRDQALAEAERWATIHLGELTPAERDFLTACQEVRTIDERERRQARRIRRLAISATIVSAIAFIAFLVAVYSLNSARVARDRAEEQLRVSTSRELAAAAINNLGVDPERSILLAMQALSVTYTTEAEDALHKALQASRVLLTLSEGSAVGSIAYSPDGTRLATSNYDHTATVWDAASGHKLLTLSGHNGPVIDVAFSSDGARLATASQDRMAKIWDAASGQVLLTLSSHTSWVSGVAFSPDGKRLATASWDKTAKVWDAITGQELLTLSGHDGPVEDIAFSPDGTHLATASHDQTARVWDAWSGQLLLTLSGHHGPVVAVAFSPDGTRLATASHDQMVRVWDATSGQALLTFSSHAYWVNSVAFSPDGKRLATASVDQTARVWDVTSGQELLTLSGHTGLVEDVAFSPDGIRLTTASTDETARVWNVSVSREWLILSGHTSWIFGVTFSPDGTRLATASYDKTAKIWDANSGQELRTLSGHTGGIRAIAFSPDGQRLATASDDRTAKIWDVASGQALLTLQGHRAPVLDVAFSPDGKRLATASTDWTAKVWDSSSGQEILSLAGHHDMVLSVTFSIDGTRLATAGADGTVKVWNAVDGRELLTLAGDGTALNDVVFSPDGTRLATAGNDGTTRIWDAVSGQELLAISGHAGPVASVVFSPDGTRLATAGMDRTAKIWGASSGQELLTLIGHDGPVHDAVFSPDGTRLATSSEDKTVRVYVMDIEDLMALARTRITRSLTSDECKKYLHQRACPLVP